MSSSCTHTKFAATVDSKPNRRRAFRSRPTFGLALALVGLLGSVPACGDDDDDSVATGGSHTGGAKSSGGTGGTALGGAVGSGGKATGGSASGGAAAGGTASGGAATGGTATGGSAGAGVGGTTSGGTAGSGTGGSTTGGTAGAETGGVGGVETGGAGGALGGADSGGNGAGGNTDGGTSVGGGGGEGGGDGLDGLVGTATRPLLTPTLAANDTVLKHLEKAGSLVSGLVSDNWDPTAGVGDLSGVTPTFHVAASGGTHITVQAAITAAVTAGGTDRVYIQVDPGTYREVVCVPNTAPPITLYSTNSDASLTAIAYDNYSAKPKALNTPANPCNANLTGTTFGTSGSATFAAYAKGFRAKNISFINDTDEAATGVTNNLQAVALMTQADQLVFENIRALGNQDTLYVKTPNVDTVARAYFKNSYIEGDVDFIFGRGTMALEGCTIQYLTTRQTTNGGFVVAPSTDFRNPFGILIINSTFTAETGTPAGTIYLGRAWDEGQADLATYANNVATAPAYPNGHVLIRESVLGAHVRSADPWRASTINRPFSTVDGTYPANRLYEFANTGPGSVTP